MQILNLQLHLPSQKMIPYNFPIAAKTQKGKYLPAFGRACSPVKQSECAEMQTGTLYWRGKKFVGEVQPTMWFVLHAGGFLQYQYHKLKLLTTSPPFQLRCFFPLDVVLVVYIPHLLVAVTQREECRVFAVPLTVPPSLWELSLQQKVWRIGKETCSHSVQLWKLLWMQIISGFIESVFCWTPVVPSIVKGISSYLHGKAGIRDGLDLWCSLSLWGFNLKLRKKSMFETSSDLLATRFRFVKRFANLLVSFIYFPDVIVETHVILPFAIKTSCSSINKFPMM